MPRVKKFGKRKFYGGKKCDENSCSQEVEVDLNAENKINLSASGHKINISDINNDNFSSENNCNIIVELNVLRELLNTISKCKNCNSSDCFEVFDSINKGLATNLSFLCTKCNSSTSSMTSRKSSKNYDINIRLVYGMRAIGRGQRSAQILCGVMNLPPPPTKFQRCSDTIIKHLTDVSNESMLQAVNETVELQEGNRDIVAAFDGTWQKRGHTSLNGVVCATSLENGKVIDVECLTKYCFACKNKSVEEHDCQKNFEGSSGGMEAAGVLNIFRRSESTRNVRYLKYLGDGDSKGFTKVSEEKVYGDNVKVEKLECIAHVQKRMGSRLRSLRNDWKKKKLSDGKCISGRGRLTDIEVDRLQMYYGQAIRKNTNSVQDMVKSIWAIFFHRLSTDSNPQHGLCPTGSESWCGYNRSKITGEQYSHKHPLPEAVMSTIKPVFRNLTDKNLLGKCLHGRTQNPNESFNNCIWERIPKTNFVGINTLKFGVMDALICFNDGMQSRITVFEKMGITPGKYMRSAMRKMDNIRICEADLKVQKLSKEAKNNKRRLKKLSEAKEMKSQKEYGPGMF